LRAGWRDAVGMEVIRKYLECVRLLRDYENADQDPVYSEVGAISLVLHCCVSLHASFSEVVKSTRKILKF